MKNNKLPLKATQLLNRFAVTGKRQVRPTETDTTTTVTLTLTTTHFMNK